MQAKKATQTLRRHTHICMYTSRSNDVDSTFCASRWPYPFIRRFPCIFATILFFLFFSATFSFLIYIFFISHTYTTLILFLYNRHSATCHSTIWATIRMHTIPKRYLISFILTFLIEGFIFLSDIHIYIYIRYLNSIYFLCIIIDCV